MKFTKFSKGLLAVSCVLVGGSACAGSWSVLGPAWSWHATKAGARTTSSTNFSTCYLSRQVPGGLATFQSPTYPLSDDQVPHVECGANVYALQPQHAVPVDGYLCEQLQMNQDEALRQVIPGLGDLVMACARLDTSVVSRWHGNNPAIGAQYTFDRAGALSGWSVIANYVRDSYGAPSLMLGGTRMWPVFASLLPVGLRLEAGLSAGLWNRTNLDGKRINLPFVLPMLSLTHKASGLGMHVAVAPPVRVNGSPVVSTTTVMWQTKIDF